MSWGPRCPAPCLAGRWLLTDASLRSLYSSRALGENSKALALDPPRARSAPASLKAQTAEAQPSGGAPPASGVPRLPQPRPNPGPPRPPPQSAGAVSPTERRVSPRGDGGAGRRQPGAPERPARPARRCPEAPGAAGTQPRAPGGGERPGGALSAGAVDADSGQDGPAWVRGPRPGRVPSSPERAAIRRPGPPVGVGGGARWAAGPRGGWRRAARGGARAAGGGWAGAGGGAGGPGRRGRRASARHSEARRGRHGSRARPPRAHTCLSGAASRGPAGCSARNGAQHGGAPGTPPLPGPPPARCGGAGGSPRCVLETHLARLPPPRGLASVYPHPSQAGLRGRSQTGGVVPVRTRVPQGRAPAHVRGGPAVPVVRDPLLQRQPHRDARGHLRAGPGGAGRAGGGAGPGQAADLRPRQQVQHLRQGLPAQLPVLHVREAVHGLHRHAGGRAARAHRGALHPRRQELREGHAEAAGGLPETPAPQRRGPGRPSPPPQRHGRRARGPALPVDPREAHARAQGLDPGQRQRPGHGLRLRAPGAQEAAQEEVHEDRGEPPGQAAARGQDPLLRLRQRPPGQPGVPLLRGRGRDARPAVPALRRAARRQRLGRLRAHVEAAAAPLGAQGHRHLLGPPVGGHERLPAGLQRGREDHPAQVCPDLLLDQRKLPRLQGGVRAALHPPPPPPPPGPARL